MPVIKTFAKDNDAKLDYTLDWSAWLPTGDTISASAWNIDSAPDASLSITTTSNTTTTTTVWLQNGTDGQRYVVRNRVTTVAGRIDDRSIGIAIEER